MGFGNREIHKSEASEKVENTERLGNWPNEIKPEPLSEIKRVECDDGRIIDPKELPKDSVFKLNGVEYRTDDTGNIYSIDGKLPEDMEAPITEDDRERIKEETGWSDDIVDALIETKTTRGQYEVYRDADLHECIVNDRLCLCKNIDMDYIDEKTGMTNRELMEKGRSPIDSKTGEKIELHHMGQDYNGPLVELNENSEHGDGNHKTLHPKHEDSFRQEPGKEYAYNYEKIQYWKARSTEGSEL